MAASRRAAASSAFLVSRGGTIRATSTSRRDSLGSLFRNCDNKARSATPSSSSALSMYSSSQHLPTADPRPHLHHQLHHLKQSSKVTLNPFSSSASLLRTPTAAGDCSASSTTMRLHLAKPKRGGAVDSYRTVSVVCSKCGTRLFRYKKKNGTKSNLVKCYVERIAEDCAGLLEDKKGADDVAPASSAGGSESETWECPKCSTTFARSAMIHGRPALKLVGGKVRMAKK